MIRTRFLEFLSLCILFSLVQFRSVGTTDVCGASVRFNKIQNVIIRNTTVLVLKEGVRGRIDCVSFCIKTSRCNAFVYDSSARTCTTFPNTVVKTGIQPQSSEYFVKEPVDCLDPPHKSNCNTVFSSTKQDSAARYSCKDGLSPLSDKNTIRCLGTGLWEDLQFSCHKSLWLKPVTPFKVSIPWKLRSGSRLLVKGTPIQGTRFTVYFEQAGVGNIPFLFSAGFAFGHDIKRIVVKARKNGRWRSVIGTRNFPFQLNRGFVLSISVSDVGYTVNAGGAVIASMYHRIDKSVANSIRIHGAVIISEVRFTP